MGSGTTGVACAKYNKNFIGIELSEKFYNMAKSNIDNAIQGDRIRLWG